MIAAMEGVDRSSARDAAADELSKRVYAESEPSLGQRALEWLWERLVELVELVSRAGVGGQVGLVLAVALLVLLVVVLRLRSGPLARRSALVHAAGARALTAADHRRLADEHSAAGRHAEAVRERMRALVRELEQRGLLAPRVGLTAGEVAAEVGAVAPALAAPLREAAAVFDEVWYGGRAATAESTRRVAAVDEHVRAARSVLAVSPTAAPAPSATGDGARR